MTTETKTRPADDTTTAAESDGERLRRLAKELAEVHPENFPHLFEGGSKDPAWEAIDQMMERLAEARRIADEPAQIQRREIKRLADELLNCDWTCLPPGLINRESPAVWQSLSALHRELVSAMGTRKL